MKRLLRSPTAVTGGVLLLLVVVASVAAPLLAPADPVKPSFGRRLQPPRLLGGASAYALGTDNLGRDILARLLYGGRVSLVLAASAVALAATAGVVVGLAAGILGGRLDDFVMREGAGEDHVILKVQQTDKLFQIFSQWSVADDREFRVYSPRLEKSACTD